MGKIIPITPPSGELAFLLERLSLELCRAILLVKVPEGYSIELVGEPEPVFICETINDLTLVAAGILAGLNLARYGDYSEGQ